MAHERYTYSWSGETTLRQTRWFVRRFAVAGEQGRVFNGEVEVGDGGTSRTLLWSATYCVPGRWEVKVPNVEDPVFGRPTPKANKGLEEFVGERLAAYRESDAYRKVKRGGLGSLRVLCGPDLPPRSPATPESLTKREREVMAHVAAGETNEQIAGSLGLAFSSVSVYVTKITRKLRAKDRAAAIEVFRQEYPGVRLVPAPPAPSAPESGNGGNGHAGDPPPENRADPPRAKALHVNGNALEEMQVRLSVLDLGIRDVVRTARRKLPKAVSRLPREKVGALLGDFDAIEERLGHIAAVMDAAG